MTESPVLDVVLPVFDDEGDLERCVRELLKYLRSVLPFPFRITIADNASTDTTPLIAGRLAAELPEVVAVFLADRGRGGALRQVWLSSDADVLAYLDVDLSTDLKALLPLVAPLVSGHSDVAIGSRSMRASRVVRGPKREFVSRMYNLIVRATLAVRFSDAQCAFKAIRADVARELLPLTRDSGWFFDTEVLVLAEKSGMRIHEVAVDWTDGPNSKVDIVPTAMDDLKGIARMRRTLPDLPLARIRSELGRSTRPPRVLV
jgi:glycosyltransferase involved in cell wall biosynthesis